MVNRFFIIGLLTIIALTSATSMLLDDQSDSGTYVAKKGGVLNKYGILEIEDSIAHLELYTKYKGEFVPVNMSWNSKIEPQMYVYNKEASDSVHHIYKSGASTLTIIGNQANIYLNNSFLGELEMSLEKVSNLPRKYNNIRNHAYMFTGRNAVGFNFRNSGIGYDNYDKLMKGHLLYKECEDLPFHDFVSKYDSVQHHIYNQIYSIQDSIITFQEADVIEE